jgi:uncharacterized membrane protein YcfT
MPSVDRRQALKTALADILAGSTFVGFGLVFAIQSLGYELGTLFRMGTGFFPLLLAVVLIGIGTIIIISGIIAGTAEQVSLRGLPWRGMVLIPLALVFFGLTVRGLGLLPAVFVSTLLGGLSSERVKPLAALAIALGLTAVVIVVFVVGLQLRIPLFGIWLRF